jgi:fumarate reductase flavoprotein subunit
MIPLLLACAQPSAPDGGRALPAVEDSEVAPPDAFMVPAGAGFSAVQTGTRPDEPPLLEVDVVVIGAGASGLAAAEQAVDQGADVLILERASSFGGAGLHAGKWFAVDTSYQAEEGVDDSVEAAAADWSALTHGGDGDHPMVRAYLQATADILDWAVGHGATFELKLNGFEPVGTPRFHTLAVPTGPLAQLGQELLSRILLETPAVALHTDVEGVDGVWIEDGWIRSDAVVVATGGFGRDAERLVDYLPGLASFEHTTGAMPHMDGNGLDLLEGVGAALTNMDAPSIYTHDILDPYLGAPEVLVAPFVDETLVVDAAGERVMNEQEGLIVWGGAVWLERGPLYAVLSRDAADALSFYGLGYNYPAHTAFGVTELAEEQGFAHAESRTELAEALGMPALEATLRRYDELVAQGEDSDFGKDADKLVELGHQLIAVPLVPAKAKSFGGAGLDLEGRVLDVYQQPIPGLYAAGEAAGVLGGCHVGWGFEGSISGVVFTGQLAGRSAGAYALER